MKDNKLLAEYLGWRKTPKQGLWYDDLLTPPELMAESDDELKFHYSWIWLMPVVDKIEEEGRRVSIEVNYCIIYESQEISECADWNIIIVEKEEDTKHEAVKNACVEYIKQKQ